MASRSAMTSSYTETPLAGAAGQPRNDDVLKHLWQLRRTRIAMVLVGGAICLAGAVTAVVLSSCGPGKAPGPVLRHPAEPLRMQGVPIVRVRVISKAERTLALGATGPCEVFAGDRRVAAFEAPVDEIRVSRHGDTWRLGDRSGDAKYLEFRPSGDGYIRVAGTSYRGRMRLVPRGQDRMLAVNHVDMESYLAGVLSKELYPNWHPEAYRTQAIAARTFALYHHITAHEGSDCDLGAGQGAQVYGGVDGETDRAWTAVRETHGQILAIGPRNRRKVFMAQYSSCCGGTVNAAAAIRRAAAIEPLHGGQVCEHCRNGSHYRWEDVAIPLGEVYRALVKTYPAQARPLGGVVDLRVEQRLHGRWVAWATVVGRRKDASGNPRTMKVRGQDLRIALMRHTGAGSKLRSICCDIEVRDGTAVFSNGRGFGHGVGLCQWGAQGKAAAGWTAERILAFYYPGAIITRAYDP